MDLLQIRKELISIEDQLHRKERILRKVSTALDVLSKKFDEKSTEYELIRNLILDLIEV